MNIVLLYYKYVQIEDTQATQDEHKKICKFFNLLGRIIIAREGINGTLAGLSENIQKYKLWMRKHPLFFDVEFKEHHEENNPFKKLHIKVRDEIITLKQTIDLTDLNTKRGVYLEPAALQALIASGEEFYIVDVRNSYESAIGKFAGSIALEMENFRDLPKAIEKISSLKDKKIVTVCTGGIRCEKASAFLLQEGFKNVYQLHGGITKYGKTFPDDGFEGKCYVFDERICLAINTHRNQKIIAMCHHCNISCDTYINCCNASCNKQFICCSTCAKINKKGCSQNCQKESRFKKS